MTFEHPGGIAEASKSEKWRINNPDNLSPREVLKEVGRLSNELFEGKHPAVPEIGVASGTFAGWGELNMDEEGNVVLVRIADHEYHLTKNWVNVPLSEMMDTSIYNGGGQGLPTSALAEWPKSFGTNKSFVGTFKIPVKVFLEMVRKGDAVLGNIGEGEIVLNPKAAEHYLASIEERPSSVDSNLWYTGGNVQ